MDIKLIEISKLKTFRNHPFKVKDDLDMKELEQSINLFANIQERRVLV